MWVHPWVSKKNYDLIKKKYKSCKMGRLYFIFTEIFKSKCEMYIGGNVELQVCDRLLVQ